MHPVRTLTPDCVRKKRGAAASCSVAKPGLDQSDAACLAGADDARFPAASHATEPSRARRCAAGGLGWAGGCGELPEQPEARGEVAGSWGRLRASGPKQGASTTRRGGVSGLYHNDVITRGGAADGMRIPSGAGPAEAQPSRHACHSMSCRVACLVGRAAVVVRPCFEESVCPHLDAMPDRMCAIGTSATNDANRSLVPGVSPTPELDDRLTVMRRTTVHSRQNRTTWKQAGMYTSRVWWRCMLCSRRRFPSHVSTTALRTPTPPIRTIHPSTGTPVG